MAAPDRPSAAPGRRALVLIPPRKRDRLAKGFDRDELERRLIRAGFRPDIPDLDGPDAFPEAIRTAGASAEPPAARAKALAIAASSSTQRRPVSSCPSLSTRTAASASAVLSGCAAAACGLRGGDLAGGVVGVDLLRLEQLGQELRVVPGGTGRE